MVNSFVAESLGSNGYAMKGPGAAALQAGCALIAMSGDLIGFTDRPVMKLPAATPTPGQVLAFNGTSWEPTSIVSSTPGGASGNLQYNNGGAFGGLSGSAVSGSDLTLGGNLNLPATGLRLAGGTYPVVLDSSNASGMNLLDITRNGARVALRADAIYSSTLTANKVMLHPGYGVRVASDVAFEFGSTAQVSDPADAKIDRYYSSGFTYLQTRSDAGLLVRNLAGNAYASAMAQAFVAQDYVQAFSRILVGNNPGGRLLPITDGIAVYNWAQTAHGKLQANEVRIMHPSDSNYGPRLQYGHQNGINVVSSDGTFRGFIGSGYGNSNGALVGSFGAIGSETYGLWTGAAGKFRIASVPGGGTTYVEFGRDATTGAGTVASDTGLKVTNLAGSADGPLTASVGTFSTGATILNSGSLNLASGASSTYLQQSGANLYISNYGGSGSVTRLSNNGVEGLRLTESAITGYLPLSITSGTVTASTPALNVSQTWNNAGANFYGVQLAITDTASGSGSRLFSGTVNTASMFYVNKFGQTVSHTIVATNPDISCGAVGLSKGDGTYTGFIEWKNPASTRKAYMGYDNTNDLSLVVEGSGGSLKLGSATYTGSLKLIGSSSNAIMSVTTGSEVTLDKSLAVSKSDTTWADANIPTVMVENTATSGSRTATIKSRVSGGYTLAQPEIWIGSENAVSGITGTFVRTVSNHPMIFYTNDVKRFELTAAGHIVPSTHNVTDLALSGTRFKDAYLQGTLYTNTGLSITGELRTAVVTVVDRQGSPVLRVNSDVNANMLVASYNSTNGTKGFLGGIGGWANMLGLASDMAVGFSSLANDTPNNLSNAVDSKIVRSSAGVLAVRNASNLSSTLEVRTIRTTSADHAASQGAIVLDAFSGIITQGNAAVAFGSGVGGFIADNARGFLFAGYANNVTNGWDAGILRNATGPAVQVQAAGGLAVRDLVGTALTPVIASQFRTSNNNGTNYWSLRSNGANLLITSSVAGDYVSIDSAALRLVSGHTLAFGASATNADWPADVTYGRNATGPAAQIQAAGGLNVKNLAGSADGPLTASSGTFSGNVNTDYVGRSSSVEPSIRFTSSQGQFWAAGVNMYYWNNNGWYPTTTGYANLGMLNQAWAALSLERPSWQGNAALLSIRHKSGGDQTHTAITVTDYGLTSYFNVAHNGNITSSGILALTSTTAASNKIQWKDDGAGDWIIASGGVASTDGFRIVKQGVADMFVLRPSYTQVKNTLQVFPVATTDKGLCIKMVASHTANPFEIQRSDGTANTYFKATGGFTFDGASILPASGNNYVRPSSGLDLGFDGTNAYHVLSLWGSSASWQVSIHGNNGTHMGNRYGDFVISSSGHAIRNQASNNGGHLILEFPEVATTAKTFKIRRTDYTTPTDIMVIDNTSKMTYSGHIDILVDKQIGTTEGQQRLYFANNTHTYYGAGPTGNHLFRRNNGAELAPVIAQTLTLGGPTTPGTGCLLYINDFQGSSYPSIKIDKATWGSPISLNWATESAGIASTGAGPLFSHVQTITTTSLANSPINGGGLDVRCEYDQPYVAGIYVRGRKTRTDAPTHPNLAYGIYAVANSGKASGLGGAAGYFLCETANVAAIQAVGATSQTQPIVLVQDATYGTVFQVDANGSMKMKASSNIGSGLGVEFTTEIYRDLVVNTTLTNQTMAVLGQLEIRPRTGATSKILMGNMSAGTTPYLQVVTGNQLEVQNAKLLVQNHSGLTSGNGIEMKNSGGTSLFSVDYLGKVTAASGSGSTGFQVGNWNIDLNGANALCWRLSGTRYFQINQSNGVVSTSANTFVIGNVDVGVNSIRLHNNSGTLRLRDYLDTSYVALEAGPATFAGQVNASVYNATLSGFGSVSMSTSGDAINTGYIEWKNPAGATKWYMGYDSGNDFTIGNIGGAGSVKIGAAAYPCSIQMLGSSTRVTLSVTTGDMMTVDKPITSAFQSLSADPTTTDIAAGSQRMVLNSTSGTLKIWANQAGVMKSVALT